MGYEAELLLLCPERNEAANKDIVVWRGSDIIDFGHVTRMEKLTSPHYRHLGFPPRERAAICIVNCLLTKIGEKFEAADYSSLAPEFRIHDLWGDEVQALAKLSPGDYIDVGLYVRHKFSGRHGHISVERLNAHNASLKLPPEQQKKELNWGAIILEVPFIWEPAATLADWLDKAEAEKTEEWRELTKESVSLALARGWRSYLREIGAAGVRALFIFP